MEVLIHIGRKLLLFAVFPAFVFSAVALSLTVKTSTQQLRVAREKDREDLIREIENGTEQPLRTLGNNNSPFQILDAKVKEIPGTQFTRLTGKTTDLSMIFSVPVVTLVNTSQKTITGFMLAIRDPYSRTTRLLNQQKIAVVPGGTYLVKREHFVDPERLTVANTDGAFRQKQVQPRLDSEKYWLQFAGRADVFIAVGRVTFDDGTSWTITEGGEVK